MGYLDFLEPSIEEYRDKYESLEMYDGFGLVFLMSLPEIEGDDYFEPRAVLDDFRGQHSVEDLQQHLADLEEEGYVAIDGQSFEDVNLGVRIQPSEVYAKALQYTLDSAKSVEEDGVPDQSSDIGNKIDSAWDDVTEPTGEASQQDVEDAMKEFDEGSSE